MQLRRGIEPIIATVILVAVALIIAVAVVGYLMGLFGGLTGGQPQISITSIRATAATSGSIEFELYVNNAGSGSDRIIKTELIVGGKSSPKDLKNDAITISANHKGWITLTCNAPADVSVSAGDTVILRLYFERSGIQTINVVVSPSTTGSASSESGTSGGGSGTGSSG